MKPFPLRQALTSAAAAARAAGALMRANLRSIKKVNVATSHDIKLDLDVRCQKLIENKLRSAFPPIAILGEEGEAGDASAQYRWVVDPIDGTVNFAYGLPHACVSIALQRSDTCQVTSGRNDAKNRARNRVTRHASHVTLLGVVYDPFQDELWTAIRGQPARLNGRVIHVSRRRKLADALLSMGFAKDLQTLEKTLPFFNRIVWRVRKVRIMGAAALALTYVATGRLDVYVERGISLWDIAAGGLIVECAGGEFWHEPLPGETKYRMVASNGLLRRQLPLGTLFK